MKIGKWTNERILYVFLFALYMACFLISTYFNYTIFDIEYAALIIIFIVGIVNIFKNGGNIYKSWKYYDQMINIIKMSLILLGISLLFQLINLRLIFITYKHLFYIMFPSITVFLLCNSSRNFIEDYFNISLIFAIIYFIIRYYSVFNMDSILNMTFLTSNSAFEFASTAIADIFFYCVVFFGYHRKYIRMSISAFFGILSFKRFIFVCIIVAIVIYIVRAIRERMGKAKKRQKYVSKTLCVALVIGICCVPYFSRLLLDPNINATLSNFFGFSVNEFLMSRVELLEYLIDKNPTNYGLGTISDFFVNSYWYGANRAMHLHNDIYRLYYETTIIGLFAFTYYMVKNTNRKSKPFIITVFYLLNLAISNVLVNFMSMLMFNLLFCDFLDSKDK